MRAKKTVTFDFDHTLKFETGDPNEEGIALFREQQADANNEVHIVTSRFESIKGRTEIEGFLSEHSLTAVSIVFTDGNDKLGHLRKLGSKLHFDDCVVEVDTCRNAGIEVVRVFDMDKWEEFMGSQ